MHCTWYNGIYLTVSLKNGDVYFVGVALKVAYTSISPSGIPWPIHSNSRIFSWEISIFPESCRMWLEPTRCDFPFESGEAKKCSPVGQRKVAMQWIHGPVSSVMHDSTPWWRSQMFVCLLKALQYLHVRRHYSPFQEWNLHKHYSRTQGV